MITVVVPHQLDSSKPYLELCLRALASSEFVDFQVLVVSGSETPPDLPPDARFKCFHDTSRVGVSAKLDLIQHELEGSTHLALISDDVMVSKYMLCDMLKAFANREMIMNPMSNSDCFSMYEADLYLENHDASPDFIRLHPDMEYDEIVEWTDEIIHYPRRPKCLIPFATLSFYCTMIPISVWNKIGNLDPNLEFRHNDQDYCLRAAKIGIPCVVNMGAFAFHFGSKTMRHMANDASKLECSKYFQQKWTRSSNPPGDSL